MRTAALKAFIRSNGYAWPCALLMNDGEVIDAQSARENYRQVRRATGRDSWVPCAVFIHWEGEPLQCAHSGRAIDSAYGVPS